MKNRAIRIIALTDSGRLLGEKIQLAFPEASLEFKPKPFAKFVQDAFLNGDALIMICATGIVFRTLASVLENKLIDPPVVACDELGQFVIPLLSGHEGGANALASQIAKHLDSQLVLTTANAYLSPVYTIGMGCERDCPESVLNDLLSQSLAQVNLTMDDIESINSIDIKSDEIGLIDLSQSHNKSFQTFDAATLRKMEQRLSVKSDYVYEVVGVYGVAESAALWAAQVLTGQPSELVLNKIKNAQATCAIARSYRSKTD